MCADKDPFPGESRSRECISDFGRPRVLVAEDDREMLHLLSWELLAAGLDVIPCRDGTQVLERLGPRSRLLHGLDLIVSDFRMPGATGLEVLGVLNEMDSHPPLILLTAFGDEDLYIKARKLGAADVIDKPFEIRELLARIHEILNTRPCRP